jgi:hypothetical protein
MRNACALAIMLAGCLSVPPHPDKQGMSATDGGARDADDPMGGDGGNIDGDDGGTMDDGGGFDQGDGGDDAGVVMSDLAPTSNDLSQCAVTVKINELQTAMPGAPEDGFIELYNGCATSFSLVGYKLVYRSAAGTHDLALIDFTMSSPVSSIDPQGFLVCGQTAFSGTAACRFSEKLSKSGGGIALLDPSATVVDSLGYGTATNAFVRGSAATAPAAGQSIGRIPDGNDTGDNSVDFMTTTAPTPGAANN